MKVFERYIFGRTLTLFCAALAWTVAIVWTTQVLTRINLVTDNGQSALTFFEIATLILPTVLPVVIPFATVLAVAQTLNVMNSDSELIVMSAAGAPRRTVIRPVMLLAVLAAIACFAIDNGAEPYARERGRELVAAARADFLSLVIQEGTFRKIDDGVYIQISERLPDGRLAGLFVADSREEGTDLVYYAKHGAVSEQNGDTVLVMRDGEIQRKMPDGDISIIRFQSYSFDMTAFTEAASGPNLRPKDRTIAYLLNPDPSDPQLGKNPLQFSAELHRRFTEWSYPIVFALIALAVIGNARSNRESRVNPLATAIIISLFVRWMGYVAANQVQTTPGVWPVVYAIPLGFSALSAFLIATNRTMELPVALAERLFSGLRRLGDLMMFGRSKPETGANA
jgi:lipopolysaccharide export system permease protein